MKALEIIRHDCAHVLAERCRNFFPVPRSPSARPSRTVFYDFYRDEPFTTDDLEVIEAKMHEVIARNAPFKRQVVSRDEAIALFKAKGEAVQSRADRRPCPSETITLYTQGDWIDLCREPTPKHHRHGRQGLQTAVCGGPTGAVTAAASSCSGFTARRSRPRALRVHLTQLEEAAKRDHRKLGKELGLFHLQEEARGGVFWHPKGWRIYTELEKYMRHRLDDAGYEEVKPAAG